jgi:hypothetical protein
MRSLGGSLHQPVRKRPRTKDDEDDSLSSLVLILPCNVGRFGQCTKQQLVHYGIVPATPSPGTEQTIRLRIYYNDCISNKYIKSARSGTCRRPVPNSMRSYRKRGLTDL